MNIKKHAMAYHGTEENVLDGAGGTGGEGPAERVDEELTQCRGIIDDLYGLFKPLSVNKPQN